MIRINLLQAERERAPKRVFLSPADRITIVAALILASTAALIGWWYWTLHERSLAVDARIVAAEDRARQIRSVLEQVRTFEAQKAVLQQRVQLIEHLRRGQGAPVRLLDEISRSLPDRLWLNDLNQSGADFTMSGMTDSLSAVSDFVANLEASDWFRRPVEIVDTQVQPDAAAGDLIRFQVKAQFVDPTAPAAASVPPAPPAVAR